MRYLLDEGLPPAAAVELREQGIDAVSVQELQRRGLSDEAQLEFAATEGRCVVTLDTIDFLGLTAIFQDAARPHHGVVLVSWQVRRSEVHRFANALIRLAAMYPDGFAPYQTVWLSRASRYGA